MRLLPILLELFALAVVLYDTHPAASAGPDLRPIVLHANSGHVKKNDEKQLCYRRPLPRGQDVDVGRVQMFVQGGSHHVHLYRPYNGEPEYPPHKCEFAIPFDHWELVSATQNSLLDWILPPGVAINFSAHQPLLIQTHFVNTGKLETRGQARAKVVLHPIDPATVIAHGGALFAQDKALIVPEGTSTWKNRCMVTGEGSEARQLTIMAFTGHYHFRGIKFEVYRVHTDGGLGERLYLHEGYDDPRFTQYKAEPLVLHPGEGIEWWCTYQNDSGHEFKFGPNTAMNEHCNLFGFYYPTATPQEAIDCVHKWVNPDNPSEGEQNIRILAQ